jgi:hypothetical protein
MRYLACMLIGIICGALISMTALKVLGANQRYPKALMQVLSEELRGLQKLDPKDCDRTLAEFKQIAGVLSPRIPKSIGESVAADSLNGEFMAAVNVASCQRLASSRQGIADACDDCHRQLR